ncbi:hypothetical protein BDV95DRAFT_110092 [Massariosphaeria phaeospora]|uniref:Transferase family-domain-containing protein n=1 Tax=Massariosphaeria phaeospora TaxID=100035 RepID=A0A7C8I491_9PLEO|nr:hypothetical protein BDV95DRAFT_110092 [Massariosphaeria phaeospora]
MSFLSIFNSFRTKDVAPARVPTDTVIPLHYRDDNTVNRSIGLDFLMQFDDVLDVDKVIGALERLLEKPGWRKLGARMRLNEQGKLEYHVPAQFTPSRPAINLTRATHDMSISDHAIGSQLPRPNGSLQVIRDSSKFVPLFCSPDRPRLLKHYIYTDCAQLSVHVVSFSDATLVSLSWLHTLLDAMGRRALFLAWTVMLEGREADVPDFYGYDFDPLAPLGTATTPSSKPEDETEDDHVDDSAPPTGDFVLRKRQLTGWRKLQFVFNFMWELFMHPAVESAVVIIPPTFFASVRAAALADLRAADPATLVTDTSDPTNPQPFLSDGDVLAAWWIRNIVVAAQPWVATASRTRTICVMNVLGMRDVLARTAPALLPLQGGAAYIANCVTAMHSYFSLHELLALPLGRIAARLRADLVEQSTRPHIEAREAFAKRAVQATGREPLFGGPSGSGDMVISAFSNWTKGRFFETDFRAAVLKPCGRGSGGSAATTGRPTCVLANGTGNRMFSARGSSCCVGRDAGGNWWVGAQLRSKAWANVEKMLEGL